MSNQVNIDLLRKRYTADGAPPCRVCGGQLSIVSFGGGRAAEWGCSSRESDPDNVGMLRLKPGRRAADEHYSRSKWTQYNSGDPEVIALLDEHVALRARVAELQAEVDACGEIIGQRPGASRGHAEIIAATIARHQEHGEQLTARVAEMEREVERLRGFLVPLFTSGYRKGHHDTVEGGYTDVYQCDSATYFADDVADWIASETAALAPRAEVKP